MKRLLLIPILLLTGCVSVNKPLYGLQPEIVRVDARMVVIKKRLAFTSGKLDPVIARRHADLIHLFYTAFEVAFADGDAEKFQLMLNRTNAQLDALNRLIESTRPAKPMGLIVPEVAL
ncbi:hypothetical protein LCGC14_1828090 [marine sediment metagenome]|uniref:Uncharacterized protein n=1 Tax=marine sediment metagenome TaxID=412755 RepID=A0A0F9JGF0_9ZZZZ